MTMVTPKRFVRSMGQTPVLLDAILGGVDQPRAMAATDPGDGDRGWSVVEVVCHLRDFDGFFRGRVESMLAEENPRLPAYDHVALARDRDYAHQDLRTAFAAWVAERRRFLTLLEGLTPAQWSRTRVHPEAGSMTILDAAVRAAHHDILHSEQIVRCLGTSALVGGLGVGG